MSTESTFDLAVRDLVQVRTELAGVREQYRRCYRAAEFAIRQAETALLMGEAVCQYHGDQFGKLGYEYGSFGLPRCDSCKQPSANVEAMQAIRAWRKAESTSFIEEVT